MVSRSSSAFISPRPLKRVTCRPFSPAAADGGEQAAEVVQRRSGCRRGGAGSGAPRCRCAPAGSATSISKPMLLQVLQLVVDRADFVQFDDVQVRARLRAVTASASRLSASSPTANSWPVAASSCLQELVELLAAWRTSAPVRRGRRGRWAAGRSPGPAAGVAAEADAAAFQGRRRFFHRRPACGRAAPSRRPRSCGRRPARRPRRPGPLEQLGLHLLFGLHVVRLPSCCARGTAAAGRRRRGRLATRSYIWR